MVGFCFLIHSATLCLFISEVFLWPFYLAFSGISFLLLPCPCVSVFFILIDFCLFCLQFLFYVIYFSSESLACGYHYEYVEDRCIYTVVHFLLHMPYLHSPLWIWISESSLFQSLLSQFVPMDAKHSLLACYSNSLIIT